jgi:hypothetical protein
MDRILALAVRPLHREPAYRDSAFVKTHGKTGFWRTPVRTTSSGAPPPLECWPKALLFTALWLLSSGSVCGAGYFSLRAITRTEKPDRPRFSYMPIIVLDEQVLTALRLKRVDAGPRVRQHSPPPSCHERPGLRQSLPLCAAIAMLKQEAVRWALRE